jgi:hypothetical protein
MTGKHSTEAGNLVIMLELLKIIKGASKMDKRENNRLQMFKSVEEYLEKYGDVTKEIPGFQNSFGDFQGSIASIEEKDKEYLLIAQGSTAEKETAEDEMIETLVKLCSLVYVFARRTKDEQLKSISKVTPSGLKYMRDGDLLHRAQTLQEQMLANKVAMEPYQITQSHIDELKARIDAYEAKSDIKENKFAERKTARQELSSKFIDATEILTEELDSLVEFIKDTHGEFYGKYQSTRLINDV